MSQLSILLNSTRNSFECLRVIHFNLGASHLSFQITPDKNLYHRKDSKQVKIDYRGWTIQLIDQNNTWQTQITSPDGMTSGLSNLVGIHREVEGVIISARNYIDKRLTWQLIRNFLEDANQQNLISWQEWENLNASLTCWAIHDD